jgi:hypothetical protein
VKNTTKSTSEEFVKRSVIKFLSKRKWSKNIDFGSLKDRGVDIRVSNSTYSRPFLIETKGISSARSSSENAFVHSLGQIVTRMKGPEARYYYGLALPKPSAEIALRRVSYQFAVGMCLHIFSVGEDGTVTWYKPRDIKRLQLLRN